MTSFVYFIQAGDERGPIKIGHSSNVERRIEELRTGNHLPISLIEKVSHPNAPDIERRLHAEFHHLRLEGEWFTYDERLREVIAVLAGKSDLDALRGCPAFLVALPHEWHVVEWSHRQGCIHLDRVADSISMAQEILLMGRGTPVDYVILAIAPSREDAEAIARAMEPTLRAVRFVRRLTGGGE